LGPAAAAAASDPIQRMTVRPECVIQKPDGTPLKACSAAHLGIHDPSFFPAICPLRLCSVVQQQQVCLSDDPPNSKGNELVKHRDLGILWPDTHTLFSSFLSLSPFLCVCLSLSLCIGCVYILRHIVQQRAHIHVVWCGVDGRWGQKGAEMSERE
jgi:hypothetical protein